MVVVVLAFSSHTIGPDIIHGGSPLISSISEQRRSLVTTNYLTTSFLHFSLFSTALSSHSLQIFSIWIIYEKYLQHQQDLYEGTLSIGGRTITNLRFAGDIDGLAGEEEELANLVKLLDKASTAYDMEISAEKIKLMANNTSDINTEIKVNGQKLETVTSFKYRSQL